MKKTIGFRKILGILIAVFLFILPVSAADTENDKAITSGCHTIDGAVPVLGSAQLVENATSVIVYERSSDTIMYSWESDAQIYPASMVKIMTALITVQKANMADVVTIKESTISAIPDGAANAKLQVNEVITVQDLLYCMMVGSANDAAAVLAEHIGGTQEGFVAMMNDYAKQIGCNSTLFTDPHGLSSEQYSTARDMARLLSVAMEDEAFAQMFCTPEYTVPKTNKSEERTMETGNLLQDSDSVIYYDDRVTGGRTGVGENGERCIAVTAQVNDLQLISIVVGTKSEYREDGYTVVKIGGYGETTFLLDACEAGFKPVQVLYDGQALKQYKINDGNSDLVVGAKKSVSTILPADIDLNELDFRYNDIAGSFAVPIEKDALVSNLEIWNGSVCVCEADLFAFNSVSLKENADVAHVKKETDRVFPVILIVLACIIAAFFCLLLVMRFISLIRQKRSRRNRRNRRRSQWDA